MQCVRISQPFPHDIYIYIYNIYIIYIYIYTYNISIYLYITSLYTNLFSTNVLTSVDVFGNASEDLKDNDNTNHNLKKGNATDQVLSEGLILLI